jgi:hypothetical protein
MHVCFEPENYFLLDKKLLGKVSEAYAHRFAGNFAMNTETACSWECQVPQAEKHCL